MTNKLNAIYLTPQAPQPTSTSLILREVMFWSQNFEHINFLPSFQAALKIGSTNVSDIDLILISSRFRPDEIRGFVDKAKQVDRMSHGTYVVILNGTDVTNRPLLLSTFDTGADGIVFKPYSAEIIDQITELASRVKTQRLASRKAATEILCDDSLILMDPIAWNELEGKGGDVRLDFFKRAGIVTLKLSPKNMPAYSAIARDSHPEIRPIKCLVSIKGSSYLHPEEKHASHTDEVLSEASMTQFRATLQRSGVDVGFLDSAVAKIRQRLDSQSIKCAFVDITSQAELA